MKITLKEFFDSNEKLVIHCNTEEKANRLLKEFDKLGKKWWNGESYLENTCFHTFKDKTCYFNDGWFCDIEFFKDKNYKIYSFEDIIFEEDNLIPEIAKMLGVEIGEEFKIKGWSSYPYTFDGVLLSRTNGNEWEHATADDYEYILAGKCTIQKLPKKPQLTEAERVILENLPKEYKWICRNQNNNLILVTKEPFKVSNENSCWNCRNKDNGENTLLRIQAFNHLFQFIKWEDGEPYNIEELLKGE